MSFSSSPASKGAGEPLPQPRRLGRYALLSKIASGGMASVYLGQATGAGGFERLVAVKCCHPHLRDDDEFRTMFLDEARLAARIHHPNVVSTLDVQDGDELYLVMEYVEGGRFSDVLRAARTNEEMVPLGTVLRCMHDALLGLHAAHVQRGPDDQPLNIVHRDVSPQNLMVGVDGVARVVDFGVAKAEARATVTSDHRLKGKLAYMAPEQLSGEGVTPRSDVFSAGVVLWEMLTGHRLFRGDSQPDVMQRVLFMPIPRPRSKRPDIPEALDAVVMRALARHPEDRWPSALELARALESADVPLTSQPDVGAQVERWLGPALAMHRETLKRAAQGLPSADAAVVAQGSEEPEATSGIVPRSGRRRRLGWALGLVGLLAAGALGAAFALATRTSTPRPPPASTAPQLEAASPARASSPEPPAVAGPDTEAVAAGGPEELREHTEGENVGVAAPAGADDDVDDEETAASGAEQRQAPRARGRRHRSPRARRRPRRAAPRAEPERVFVPDRI